MTLHAQGGPRSLEKKHLWLVLALLTAYLLLAFVWQDIPLWDFDDAMYMTSAKTVHAWMFAHGLATMPLYALWLRGVGLVFHDPVWCQFASWVLLVVAVTVVPLVAGVRRAWIVGVVLLAVPFFRIQPYVSLFSAALLLLGAVVLLRGRTFSLAQAAALATVVLFVTAYARPESSFGVIVAAVVTVVLTLLEKREGDWLRAVVPAVLLGVVMMFVMRHSDMSRSGVAFAQHYNVRAAAQGRIPVQGAWDSEYAYTAFGIDRQTHGGRHAMNEFARANPKLFAKHVVHDVVSPLTVLTVGFTLAVVMWPWFGERKKDRSVLRAASVYVLLVSLPTFGAMTMVYPDRHYMQIILPALLLLAAQFVQEPSENAVRWVAGAAVVMMVLFGMRHTPMAQGRLAVTHPGLDTIACLREMERDVPVRNDLVFDGVGIRAVYLLQPKTVVIPQKLPTWAVMEAAVKQQRPGWVVLTPGAAEDRGTTIAWANDVLTAQNGYAAHVCPKVDVVVFTAR